MADQKSYFDEPEDLTSEDTTIASEASFDETTTRRTGAAVIRIVLAALLFAVFAAASWVSGSGWPVIAGLVAALLLFSCTHVVLEWERAVVLRCGKFHRVAGPGLVVMCPVIDSVTATVDMRMRSTAFKAEHVLTADLVPVDVDAVLFWHVWDAKAACLEVGDFTRAVEMAAQTALRDAIGRASVSEVAIRREQLDRELKRVLEEKVAPWGVTVLSVEVRDILLPRELQETMSLEAQAEQRKKARIILMEAEQDVFETLAEMEDLVGGPEAVGRLRTMHLLNESLREGQGTVVIPSAFAEGFNDGLSDLLSGKNIKNL